MLGHVLKAVGISLYSGITTQLEKSTEPMALESLGKMTFETNEP